MLYGDWHPVWVRLFSPSDGACEDDLGVFAGFEGKEVDSLGKLEEEVVLEDGVDQLIYLRWIAVPFCCALVLDPSSCTRHAVPYVP